MYWQFSSEIIYKKQYKCKKNGAFHWHESEPQNTCRSDESIQLANTLALSAVSWRDKFPSKTNGYTLTTEYHLNVAYVSSRHHELSGWTPL